jgi:hypothetical protein
METARLILATILLLFAAFVVVMNWVAVGISTRNKRRGIDHHSSMVPLMSVLASTIAFFIYPYRPAEWVFIIPLIDLSNWCLLWWPFLLLKERKGRNTTEQDGTSNGG